MNKEKIARLFSQIGNRSEGRKQKRRYYVNSWDNDYIEVVDVQKMYW